MPGSESTKRARPEFMLLVELALMAALFLLALLFLFGLFPIPE
jgi:hypothetical protein